MNEEDSFIEEISLLSFKRYFNFDLQSSKLDTNKFHLEISGNAIKEEQLKNRWVKKTILSIFHLEISGIDINEEHPENKPNILITLLTFHLEISGNDINEEHP